MSIRKAEMRAPCEQDLATIIISFFLVLFMISPAFSQVTDSNSEFQPGATAAEREWAEGLKRKAELGNAEAQNDISKAYINGYVFRRNARAAARWAHAAANQGSVEAQVNLGTFYYAGKGVAVDYAQAQYWLQKAADQGNAKAEQNLGVLYTRGQGVKRNLEEAIRWFLKAAEQGDAPAAYNVGVSYSKGIGVAKDEVKGYMWHLLAVRFGDLHSRKVLKTLDKKLGPARVAEARSRADEWVRKHPNVKPIPL